MNRPPASPKRMRILRPATPGVWARILANGLSAMLLIAALASIGFAQDSTETGLAETPAPQWEQPAMLPSSPETPEQPSGQPAPQAPAGETTLPGYFQAHQTIWDAPPAAPDGQVVTADSATEPEHGWRYYATRSVIGLLVVCGGIILTGRLLRKYGKQSPLLAGQRLGTVMGKVHLGPRMALHYVKTGERVLVIGTTPNSISLVAEFDSGAFDTAEEPSTPHAAETARPASFLDQLHTQADKLRAQPAPVDDELASLRSDIQRLQLYLRENARDGGE